MKNKNSPFSQFLLQIAHLQTFTPNIVPLITVDTTSIKPLNQLYDETFHGSSKEQKHLHFVAEQHLKTLKNVQRQYDTLYQQFKKRQHKKKQKINESKNIKSKQLRNVNKKYKQFNAPLNCAPDNDENINMMNFGNQNQQKNHQKQAQGQEINMQLKQIIRPEYRKEITYATNKINLSERNYNKNNISKTSSRPIQCQCPRQFIQPSDSLYEEQLPIVSVRISNRRPREVTPQKSERSVSPKVEGKRRINKSQLTNISSISRKVQTASDLSLDLDLCCINILPQTMEPAEKIEKPQNVGTKEAPQKSVKNGGKRGHTNVKERTHSQQIQEEEPWQCDEDELEEELRQIDERLSHRGKKWTTQTQQETSHIAEDDFSHIHQLTHSPRIAVKGKEPKTVRLSLTPTKTKGHSKNKKIQVKNITRSPMVERQPSEQIRCAKWKKTGRGNITVDIQKYMHQN